MTLTKNIRDFVGQLVGLKIVSFCCTLDMLDFGFGEDGETGDKMALHAMGLSRVILDGDILITTADYQSWDEIESTNNDEWYNVWRFKDKIIGQTVVSVSVNELNDLRIVLDGGAVIECLIANAYPHFSEELEQWVLFETTGERRMLFAYNKEIDIN
ncbi:MAG: hypothetical protein IJL87_04495 [Clostridia bacterium]|nr:hypothetical protein [Clostridia bacterium]